MAQEFERPNSADGNALYPDRPVLIVEDDRSFADLLVNMLRETGITHTEVVSDPRLVFPAIEEHQSELVLLDLGLPFNIRGEDILERLARERPQALVVVITGDNNPNTIVSCMRHGAYDYIVKPVQVNRLSTTLNRALELTQLRRENVELKHRMLRDQLEHPEHFSEIITMDRQMVSIMAYLETVARNTLPVLIHGELGTGKDLLAKALHTASGRRGEFITLPAPGLKSDVFLPLLFGIMAPNPHPGLAEVQALLAQARGGTLVIQEVGEADEESQARMLNLFEKRKWARLDPHEPVNLAGQFDVRVVLTTRLDLGRQVDKGLFRKDLFYRIQGQTVEVPPLRQRQEDIPVLANHFLALAAETYQRTRRPMFDAEAMELLRHHNFEGNVRELQGIVTQALSSEKGSRLRADRLRKVLQRKGAEGMEVAGGASDFTLRGAGAFPTFKKTMNILIKEAMSRTGGKQTEAAKLLGISRQALNKRLKSVRDKD